MKKKKGKGINNEKYYLINVEKDLLVDVPVGEDDTRNNYEIIRDYLESCPDVETYELIEDETGDLLVAINSDIYNYNISMVNVSYDYQFDSDDDIYEVFFKVDEENEWTQQREDQLFDLLRDMTDEEIEDLKSYFSKHYFVKGYDAIIFLSNYLYYRNEDNVLEEISNAEV